jgi:hypothetical protein
MNFKFEVGQKVYEFFDEDKTERIILEREKTKHHGNIYRLNIHGDRVDGWRYEKLIEKKNKIEVEIYE